MTRRKLIPFGDCLRRLLLAGVLAAIFPAAARAVETAKDADKELPVRWQYLEAITAPAESEGLLADVILGRSVFSAARLDLADLRVRDKTGRAVPYALRVLRSEHRRIPFAAKEFNRAEGAGGARELVLDLERENLEHNQVEINTPGAEFRRRVEVEGSSDAQGWRKLATTTLVRFDRGKEKRIDDRDVTYPPSRFRYLRIRVFPDPAVDKRPFRIGEVQVVRKVEIPGEDLWREAELGEWEGARVSGGHGSTWIIDLGGRNIPCQRVEFEIDDPQFARSYYVEAGGPPDSRQRFYRVALEDASLWQRRAGDETAPMAAVFRREVRAARLRLSVRDDANPPLKIRRVRFSAPARQVVFDKSEGGGEGLRLYFGNPDAEAPNYDFARNLPERLTPPPARTTLGPRQINPAYEPPPLPLTERWPWLIYVVLGAVGLLLAAIIVSLARTTIARHDAAVAASG